MAEPAAERNAVTLDSVHDGKRPLNAVIFDAGGTLVRLDFEWMSAALRQFGFAIDPGRLRRAEIEGRRRYDHSGQTPADGPAPLGVAGDVRAYFSGMLAGAGCPPHLIGPAVVRFLAHERASGLWARPMEGAREAIDHIGAMGLRRAVVSNSDGRAESHLQNSGVWEGIEFVVDSHLVGVEKPNPRIFAIALERLGIEAERALYVGDIRSVDERGARAAGLHFVLIDPYGDYAAPGSPAIRRIEALADWVGARFHVAAARTGASESGGRETRCD